MKLGRADAARDAAWADFAAHPSKESYEDLMRYVPKAERIAWHAKAMEASDDADLHSLIELWLETDEIGRLVERLRLAGDGELERVSHYTMEPVVETLSETYPDVAARVCRALGVRILKAKKSKYYDAALSHFATARSCYERADLLPRWEDLLREIRAEHSRKTGFMPGFESLVAGGDESPTPTFLERAKARWASSRGG